ncbi:hypothetical protein OUZ56_013500 [Daphnia magna]|uniref:Uncharacterized protein n=1 Tax=Daphnia magna TaxID=35525 RepID=A0ABQ9Z628_9CRUS|nr:hypothetical protein OUZ56_013500 [Daphnia magna]
MPCSPPSGQKTTMHCTLTKQLFDGHERFGGKQNLTEQQEKRTNEKERRNDGKVRYRCALDVDCTCFVLFLLPQRSFFFFSFARWLTSPLLMLLYLAVVSHYRICSQTTKKTGKMLKPKKEEMKQTAQLRRRNVCAARIKLPGSALVEYRPKAIFSSLRICDDNGPKGLHAVRCQEEEGKKEVSGCCCVLLAPLMMQMKAPGKSIGYRFLFAIMEK